MSLDFSHCSATWAYQEFKQFRERLAGEARVEAAGIARDDTDPILILLNHSDCDGHIEAAECEKLARRLYDLIKGWPEWDRDRREALELARGLRLAARLGERLQFR